MEQRKDYNRLLCADMVEVEWIDRKGRLCTEMALLEDISMFGVCIQMEQAVAEDVSVLVNFHGNWARATVRYCQWREIGYFAGLTFMEGSSWSKASFRPQHLTDLSILPLRS